MYLMGVSIKNQEKLDVIFLGMDRRTKILLCRK